MVVAGLFALYIALKAAWAYTPGLWAKFVAWRNTPRATGLTVVGPVDDDALDLAAFRRLEGRFNRTGCVEGKKAMKIVGQHFLSGHEE